MTRIACVVFCALISAGCSSSIGMSGGNQDSGMDGGGDGGNADSGGTGDAGNSGDSTTGCTSAAQCAGNMVCDPDTDKCVDDLSCTEHGQCGAAAHCADGGTCAPSATGSPCATEDNCISGETCLSGFCGCDGVAHQRELVAKPLDVYFILDRTGSMGTDCDYVAGNSPPVSSKACYATYAVSDYLINVTPVVDTRLAFQFMSQPSDCDGTPYETPLVGFTTLPVASDHTIIQEISDENFAGGLGTHIEGALRGLASFTAANQSTEREMIGVLMTDGNPEGCEQSISTLATIISNHLTATGIRTYIIGMTGATESNLETLAAAGGAEPHSDYCGGVTAPCQYWNVGTGAGDAIESALNAIIEMSAPLPCHFEVGDLTPPPGETINYERVNVTLTENNVTTTIGQVLNESACPGDQLAWYYDDPVTPTEIHLCPHACDVVSEAGEGASVNVVVGCQNTVILL